jgi:hypothetical protein
MKWSYEIKVKDLLTSKTTEEVVKNLYKRLEKELKGVQTKVTKSTISPNDKDYLVGELEDLIHVMDEAYDIIDDLPLDEVEEDFNYILDRIYDLGDTRIKIGNGFKKFMWVG